MCYKDDCGDVISLCVSIQSVLEIAVKVSGQILMQNINLMCCRLCI